MIVIDDFNRCASCGHSARAHKASYDEPGAARGGCAAVLPCPSCATGSRPCPCPAFAQPASASAPWHAFSPSSIDLLCLVCGRPPAAHE